MVKDHQRHKLYFRKSILTQAKAKTETEKLLQALNAIRYEQECFKGGEALKKSRTQVAEARDHLLDAKETILNITAGQRSIVDFSLLSSASTVVDTPKISLEQFRRAAKMIKEIIVEAQTNHTVDNPMLSLPTHPRKERKLN